MEGLLVECGGNSSSTAHSHMRLVCSVPTHKPCTAAPSLPSPSPAALQLPRPTAHGRAAAKTHLPTDESALNQLRQHSPLPSLVLQYRALQVALPSLLAIQ